MTDTAKVIGGFRVLKDLKAGVGSQGTVYQAVCEVPCFPSLAVGDIVALKVMAVQDDDGEAFARLEKRTSELVALDHPNVVKYHGCFREQGPFNDVHVIVLEFVDGRSLKAMLEDAPCGLGTEETMHITRGLVDALAYTSSRGIVHRDIKPANIIVRPDGSPKLIDFEVSRRTDGTMTTGGSNMIGTFDYMAPDFTEAEFRGDVTSDVFSMGVCFHEMLTGRTPYRTHSGTSSQANVAFLQRWLKAGSMNNPLRVSSRVGKLLVGARDLLERALAPDRSQRVCDFVAFGELLDKVSYRELAHGGHVWRLLSYVGHGGFGEVFAGVDRKTGELVAVKHLLNASGLDRFRREAHVMRKVTSECFTRFVDWFTADEGSAFLVMGYLDGMPGSSLKDVLKMDGRNVARGVALTAFIRYAHGLADLHALGVVHRDIKPANLYFPVADPSRAVIMDLGIARDVSGTATVGQVPGTIDFMPPECVTGKTRGGPEADVWALGLCLYEALTGRMAYPRLPDGVAAYEKYFRRVKDGVQPDFSGVSDQPELKALLMDMCNLNPERRLHDMRVIEYRLRLANGEEPSMLPVPAGNFVWKGEVADADFADAADAESESGMTLATVCGNDDLLSRLRDDFARDARRRTFRRMIPILMLALVAIVGGGGYFAWRQAEIKRRDILAEAERRAQIAAEQSRAREESLRKERAAAERKAEQERQKLAEERRKAEEARIEREKADEAMREAERLRAEKAEADKKAAEKARADQIAAAAEERARIEREAAQKKAAAERAAAARAAAERAAAEKAEREAAEQEALRKKAEADRIAREQEENARKLREQAEKERKAREEKSQRERKAKLDKLDASFKEYTRQYREKLDEALKPGSRIDPVQLQQEWLIKKRAYQAARKKLEK